VRKHVPQSIKKGIVFALTRTGNMQPVFDGARCLVIDEAGNSAETEVCASWDYLFDQAGSHESSLVLVGELPAMCCTEKVRRKVGDEVSLNASLIVHLILDES